MASIIHATGHGLVAGDTFKFANVLPTDSGIDETVLYYVLAAGLGADQFEFSTSAGGTPFVLTKAITDGSLIHDDTFDVVVDGIMDPPPTPATPTGLAWTSAVALDADGHQTIRIDITIDAATDPQTRNVRVEITGPAGQAAVVVLQPDETAASFVGAIGNVSYSLTAKAYDVFGNASAATAAVVHTTAKDTTAPAVPTGLAASNGILGIGVVWNSNTEADFDHYDVLVDDDVAFGSPLSFTFRGSLASITPLTAPQTYYVKVRAVDTSGNASAYCTAASAAARLTGTSDLDPTAIINQATNLLNGPATVKVDSTGLTVENGALILKDEFGTTVMVASGFSGSWADFVATGIYNGAFKAGTAGIVGLGRTVALPYWTVANGTGTPFLTFLNPGIKFTFNANNDAKTITSDFIPVLPGQQFEVAIAYESTRVAGNLELDIAVTFWDITKTFSSSGGPGTVFSSTASQPFSVFRSSVDAGSTDYYATVSITATETVAHNAGNLIKVWNASFKQEPEAFNDIQTATETVSTILSMPVGGDLQIGTDVVALNRAHIYMTSDGFLHIDGDGADSDSITHLVLAARDTEVWYRLILGLRSTIAPSTNEGSLMWDDTLRTLVVGDSVRVKPVGHAGWALYGLHPRNLPSDTYATAINLAAVSAGNGGACAIPIVVPAPMYLKDYVIRSTDTANARAAEVRLFVSRKENSATIDFVTGTDATWSFTPSAASNRTSSAVSGAPVLLPAGMYWAVIRNTSSAQTFGIGAAAAPTLQGGMNNETKSIAALGTTIDVQTGWTGAHTIPGIILRGTMPDGTTTT